MLFVTDEYRSTTTRRHTPDLFHCMKHKSKSSNDSARRSTSICTRASVRYSTCVVAHNERAYIIYIYICIQVFYFFFSAAFSASFRSFLGTICTGLYLRGGAGKIPNLPKIHSTRLVGCAPTLIQYLTRSCFMRISFKPNLFGTGLYVPSNSKNLPLRGALPLAATILKNG
jgi:hypothetical protein